ncbi:MAG TPA: DUF542 domain-containing protein [Chitinophagaceae bacterium]
MSLYKKEISDDSLVTDLVAKDYRTSAVFRKYGIEYCCGGRIPLQTACEIHGLSKELVKKELADSIRDIHISSAIDFDSWEIDFLVDYIRNIHHGYLQKNLGGISDVLARFAEGHDKKFTWITPLISSFNDLKRMLVPHIRHEEEVIFPYIRQIAHAYHDREPYAALLVRTLRKPVEDLMQQEHEQVGDYLRLARELTSDYTLPPNACVTHRVCLSQLLELDNELVQHTHLENNILFPKALAMEKELLGRE